MIRIISALALLCFCSSLSAVCSEKNGTSGLGIGYRKDSLSFAFSADDQQIYQEASENLSGLLLEPYLTIEKWNFLFDLRGDFGWFVAGRTKNDPTIGVSPAPQFTTHFDQSAGGFFADGEAKIGFIVGLSSGVDCVLIPQGGISANYQQLKRGINRPETYVNSAASASYDLSHTRLKQLWWGPFVGGDLRYRPIPSWTLQAGYTYHFLYYQQDFEPFSQIAYTASNAEYFIQTANHANFKGGTGQTIRGKIGAQVSDLCWLNICFEKIIFSTEKKRGTSRQNIQQVYPVPNAFTQEQSIDVKAWRHAMTTVLEVEYFF